MTLSETHEILHLEKRPIADAGLAMPTTKWSTSRSEPTRSSSASARSRRPRHASRTLGQDELSLLYHIFGWKASEPYRSTEV